MIRNNRYSIAHMNAMIRDINKIRLSYHPAKLTFYHFYRQKRYDLDGSFVSYLESLVRIGSRERQKLGLEK